MKYSRKMLINKKKMLNDGSTEEKKNSLEI